MQDKADHLRGLLRLARLLRTEAGNGPHPDHAILFAQTAEALERSAQEIAYGRPAGPSAPRQKRARAINLVC